MLVLLRMHRLLQVARAVHAAVESAQSGQKRQDKLRAQVNHGFNQVGGTVLHLP